MKHHGSYSPVILGLTTTTLVALSGLPAAWAAGDMGSMPGMDNMPGMDKPASPKPASAGTAASTLVITASLNPNPPIVGQQTLDLQVTTPGTGKPATGLKLTATVAMTSMDMGTTKPVVREKGNGRYSTTVEFTMAGPWRVSISGTGPNNAHYAAAFDFEAGGKSAGKSSPIPFKQIGTSTPGSKTMTGMDMGGMDMGGMDMGKSGYSGAELHKWKGMPLLREKRVVTVTGNEDWTARTGFGHNAGMVGMMSQMMVGGSKMEGMKMGAMNMEFGESNYTGVVDADTTDSGDAAAPGKAPMAMPMADPVTSPATPVAAPPRPAPQTVAQPVIAAPATAPSPPAVALAPADTGNQEPPSVTAAPVTPPTSPPSAPAASSVAMPLKVTAKPTGAPKVGDNQLRFTVLDAKGQPVAGAKLSASVAMTSMDMGTTHPLVKAAGRDQYGSTVNFSMAGPWRVTLKVVAPGQKPAMFHFDFEAK